MSEVTSPEVMPGRYGRDYARDQNPGSLGVAGVDHPWGEDRRIGLMPEVTPLEESHPPMETDYQVGTNHGYYENKRREDAMRDGTWEWEPGEVDPRDLDFPDEMGPVTRFVGDWNQAGRALWYDMSLSLPEEDQDSVAWNPFARFFVHNLANPFYRASKGDWYRRTVRRFGGKGPSVPQLKTQHATRFKENDNKTKNGAFYAQKRNSQRIAPPPQGFSNPSWARPRKVQRSQKKKNARRSSRPGRTRPTFNVRGRTGNDPFS